MVSSIQSAEQIDYQALINLLQNICQECDLHQTKDCKQATCLIGFPMRSLQFAAGKGILDIPGADKLIPRTDLKHYFLESVTPALAETCYQCRECRDNHSPNCVIALTRTCLENTVLEENISYPGSVFLYLTSIKKQNPKVAQLLAQRLESRPAANK